MLCELAGCGSYVLLLDTPLGFQTICVRLVQAMLETFFRLVQKPCRDLLFCIALCLNFLRKPQYYFAPISSHLYCLVNMVSSLQALFKTLHPGRDP